MSDQVGSSGYLGNRTTSNVDNARQVGRDDDRISGLLVQPQQSGWMVHWTQSSFKSLTQSLNHTMNPFKSEESECHTGQYHLHSQLETAASISSCLKQVRDVNTAEKVEIMCGNLRKNSENVNSNRVDCQQSVVGEIGPRKENAFSIPKSGAPSQGDDSLPDDALYHLDFHLKSHDSLHKNIPLVSKTLENRFLGSTSRTFEYGIGQDISAAKSFACIQEGTSWPSFCFKLNEKEHLANANYYSNSSILRHGKADRSELLDSPLTRKTQPSILAATKWEELRGSYGVETVPLQVSPPELRTSEKFYLSHSALSKIPPSLCNLETMKTYTTVSSKRKVSGGSSKTSQTTSHVLIPERSDVDMSEQSQIFKESMLLTKLKEGHLKGLHYISSQHGHHNLTGGKLQPLGNTINMRSGEDARHIISSAVELKHESSSKTDTMDMDNFQNHRLNDVALPRSNKETKKDQDYSSVQDEYTLSGNRTDNKSFKADLPVINQEPETSLPDINQQLTVPFDMESPVFSFQNSISRTQSLDAEHLITHAEHPKISKSPDCPDSILCQEPGSRWVKRLKLSPSGYCVHNTKSSRMGRILSSKKVHRSISKFNRNRMNSPEADIGSIHREKQKLLDPAIVSLKKSNSHPIEPLKKDRDVSLSHPWFRRWCSHQATSSQNKSELAVICTPHTSSTALNDVQDKQFPSITAMALTGRAMSGFQPCEFQKRDSCLIWNVDGF